MTGNDRRPGVSIAAGWMFLSLILAGDCLYLTVHLLQHTSIIPRDLMLNIGTDRGVAEFYQYQKYLWCTLLMLYTAHRQSKRSYLSWVLVFVYLLMDDGLRLHEIAGEAVSEYLALPRLFGLRGQDLGETLYLGATGSVLFVALVVSYWFGDGQFRALSRDLLALVFLLAFFEGGLDILHQALRLKAALSMVTGVLEEFGGMLAISLMLWRCFLAALQAEPRAAFVDRAGRYLMRWGSRARRH